MVGASMTVASNATVLVRSRRLEQAALVALGGMLGALQFSIAAGQILLLVAVLCWTAVLIVDHERVEVPRFFWPLAAYGGITLISAVASQDPRTSLMDCKQLVLFVIVPLVSRLAIGTRGVTLTTALMSFGAASALLGIFQFAVLHYDNLGQRVQGTLGHYMTYSGLLTLIIGVALARLLFGRGERTWAALVMPALTVAVAVTFTRSAMVGVCAGAALLLALKDYRLLAALPVVAAVFFSVAPATISARFMSTFDPNNATRRDRFAMLAEGERMVRAHPLLGVGPNMVEPLYNQFRDPERLRDPEASQTVNPHLHNVPVQIAAERGLIALGAWIWFMVVVVRDLFKIFRLEGQRFLAASGLAAVASMLAAGMFEYNFGNSEFLMVFLALITLPMAACHQPASVPRIQ
jgi:O-antigen ligase